MHATERREEPVEAASEPSGLVSDYQHENLKRVKKEREELVA